MPTPVRKPHPSCPACGTPLPEPEPKYQPPAEVFAYWYNKLRARSPGERPSAEEIHHASDLPVSTCKWYRQRYESVFPDAYALAQVRENLKLSRRQLRRRRKQGAAPPATAPR